MVALILFIIYLFGGTLILHGIIRKKVYPFTIYHTSAVILFKVMMGCLYGWIFLRYYGGDDTWNYFLESRDQTSLLLHHPISFFRDFTPEYALKVTGYHPWHAAVYYVVHFERIFMIKGLAILNLLSGKNYYVNVLLFEFLTIAGPLLLFKLLARLFPLRTGINFLLVFFIPSVTFWCSGIRAEALLLLFMALMVYNGYKHAQKARPGRLVGIILGALGLLLIRYQYFLVFIPGFLAYWISLHRNQNRPALFNRFYGILALIFLVSLFLPPVWQLSTPLARAQQSFFSLHGNTRYGLDSLKPGIVSVVKILPQAVANSMFRPSRWEGKHGLQSVSAIEVLFMVIGFFYFMLGPARKSQISHPVFWLFLYYAILQMVLIGYTVPFPGAIVRYRSIPFLLLSLFLYAGNPLWQQKIRYRIFKLH